MKHRVIIIIVAILVFTLIMSSMGLVAQTGNFKIPFQTSFKQGNSSIADMIPWMMILFIMLLLMYFVYRWFSA